LCKIKTSYTMSACLLLLASAESFTLTTAPHRLARAATCRMMFGGGGDGGEAGFMDKLKAAKDMFNPEMMKKYSEVGAKVQALQEELTQTEVECATNEGGIVVKVSGTQVPLSIEISDAMCAAGAEVLSGELSSALKQAHGKSGSYAQQRMAGLYDEMGLAGLGAPPKQ